MVLHVKEFPLIDIKAFGLVNSYKRDVVSSFVHCVEHIDKMSMVDSVTTLANLLDFGQLFKAFGNN